MLEVLTIVADRSDDDDEMVMVAEQLIKQEMATEVRPVVELEGIEVIIKSEYRDAIIKLFKDHGFTTVETQV